MRDVGMVQGGERLRLAREPREPLGIAREELGQHLDGDVAIELRVARAIHLAHARLRRGVRQISVRPECCAGPRAPSPSAPL